jgi:4-amino-4-deoxychorismate lyase
MHTCFVQDDRLVRAPKAGPAAGSFYGRGVFTTVAVYHGRPFLWPEHWARLIEHAARVRLDTSGLEELKVRALLAELIAANGVQQGRARLTLLTTVEQGVWEVPPTRSSASPQRGVELTIITGEMRPPSEDGLALTVSPYRVNTLSPLAGVKSVNYLERLLAFEEARSRDFDEAVNLNERGEVAAATLANIFWITNGTLHTPALSTGALEGTTRAEVIRLAAELSVPVIEGVYDLADLGDASEIFLTSSGQGVSIVTTFDFHRYTVAVGSIALRVREAFRQSTLQAD